MTTVEVQLKAGWREALEKIVAAFNSSDTIETLNHNASVEFDPQDVDVSLYQIASYPASNLHISDTSWKSSVAVDEGGFWNCLLDVATSDELRSDLVLPFRVMNDGGRDIFKIGFIHVP